MVELDEKDIDKLYDALVSLKVHEGLLIDELSITIEELPGDTELIESEQKFIDEVSAARKGLEEVIQKLRSK